MQGSCERAIELGLPAIAFTEHLDGVRFIVPPARRDAMRRAGHMLDTEGRFVPPPFDIDGYLEEVARCRSRFPELHIVTGAELGEPHWFPEPGERIRATGAFERLLGSLHSIRLDGRIWAVDDLFGAHAPEGLEPYEVVRHYLAAVRDLLASSATFAVLAHLDFPLRRWPTSAGPFRIHVVEDEFRATLADLAASGRALEVNTVRPLDAEVVRWWVAAGGDAVTFGSDAHQPSGVGRGFRQAAAMAEAHGFRPGPDPAAVWLR